MDIFFSDPSAIPLPPEEVRINRFEANLWPDRRRVRVHLEVTPFLKRPNGEIIITNVRGDELSNISIVETMDPKMELTLHLRGAELAGPYTASVWVFYYEESEPQGESELPEQGDKIIVDQAQIVFDAA